ncbi:ATP-binding protein [uncultured Bacteroides sp.]|uniref:ATP-binding protein n=1 Tax=uncultured Bacteroides sp. TaxID=162156 RepID=UPI002AA612B6|nr:ATP-binding protein [uncultured Bacteroides sp.]
MKNGTFKSDISGTLVSDTSGTFGVIYSLDANTTVADAVLDRIVHTAQRFLLTGESMRKK